MIKFFLGSVPFGCDNIGDEAILASIIKMIRRNFPDSEICVATAKPKETAQLFSCNAVGLLGFGALDENPAETIKAIENSHVYIWAGATGLSDYPEAGLVGLRVAQRAGIKTIVWNVGMDSEFNPAHFKLAGRKAKVCDLATKCTFNIINFRRIYERWLVARIGRKLNRALQKCSLVFTRDIKSLKRLRKFAQLPNAAAVADSAVILTKHSDKYLADVPDDAKKALLSDCKKIGVCISSQRPLENIDSLCETLDDLLERENTKIFFIPMNPKTDLALMERIRNKMKRKSDSFLVSGVEDYHNVLAVAYHCDVIVSSRLHLLILSANVGTAIVGIARGSKISNFLEKFDLTSVGSVKNCNFEQLKWQVNNAIDNPQDFADRREKAYNLFQERIAFAEQSLVNDISQNIDNFDNKNTGSSKKMNDDDLNIIQDKDNITSVLYSREVSDNFLSFFQFDIKAMLLFVATKWKPAFVVFLMALVVAWGFIYYLSHHSSRAWAANVKIYHQTRSDKIPTFYMPMRTETVARIFTSRNVTTKVASELNGRVQGFKPSMLGNVEVSIEKAKSDIITITAYSSSPKASAAIANKVADFGIAEYLSRQNSSVNAMLNERLAKKKERLGEIAILKDKMCKLVNRETQRFPTEDMALHKEELSRSAAALNSTKLKLVDLDIKIVELRKMLNETPKEIEFETTLDHTTQISLEGKLSTLKQLRKRYTDENPKIKMLLDEIHDLQEQQNEQSKKKSMPSKITYRKNLTYSDLEQQLVNANLEKKSLEKLVSVYEKQVKATQEKIHNIHDKLHDYEALLMQESVLKKQIERIDLSLQNIEVLATTSVPDLTIFTHADVPTRSTMRNHHIKGIAIALVFALIYLSVVVVRKILRFKFLASKEFTRFGLKDFGEIPLLGTVEKYVRDAAITKTYSLLVKSRAKKRSGLFVKYNESQCCNSIIDNIVTLNNFNKYRTFRIDCVYKSEVGEPPKYFKSIHTNSEDASQGVFEYYDPMHIHEQSFHNLMDDIKTLSENYESVILTVRCSDNYFVVSKLATIVNLIVFMPSFDVTKKVDVITPQNVAKDLLSEDKDFGGILIQVPKYYYERR